MEEVPPMDAPLPRANGAFACHRLQRAQPQFHPGAGALDSGSPGRAVAQPIGLSPVTHRIIGGNPMGNGGFPYGCAKPV